MRKLLLVLFIMLLSTSAHAVVTLTWGTAWAAIGGPPSATWEIVYPGGGGLIPVGQPVELVKVVGGIDPLFSGLMGYGDDVVVSSTVINSGGFYPGGGGVVLFADPRLALATGDVVYIRAYDLTGGTPEEGVSALIQCQKNPAEPGTYTIVETIPPRPLTWSDTTGELLYEGGIVTYPVPEPGMLLLGIPAVAMLLRRKK